MDNNWCPPEQLKLQEKIRKGVDDLDISYVNDVEIVKLMVKAGLGITVCRASLQLKIAVSLKPFAWLIQPSSTMAWSAGKKNTIRWFSPSATPCKNRRNRCSFFSAKTML